jgi:hypothetical protein
MKNRDPLRGPAPPKRRRREGGRRATAMVALGLTLSWTATASAQLDPLLFVKRVPPTVIIVVDTSMRMLEDGSGNYYDPNTYSTSQDPAAAAAFGLDTALVSNYRRTFRTLQYENVQDSTSKFEVRDITAVPNTAAAYGTFWGGTRLEIMKSGIAAAVAENAGSQYRWGLIKLRQNSPAWRASGSCDKPVRVTENATLALASDTSPCSSGPAGRFGIYVPSVSGSSHSITTSMGGGAQVVAPASGTATSVLTVVSRGINVAGGLIPASAGTRSNEDRPLTFALEDARTAAINAMNADAAATRSCRNTVVVLITGGKDDGGASYLSSSNPTGVAATFLDVRPGDNVSRRVPIHVVAVKPDLADETPLQAIATASGGRYTRAASAAGVAAAINHAVQTGFARYDDFRLGNPSEYLPVSPIVGTVNLKNARAHNGSALPDTDIVAMPGGQPLPQRSNMMVSSGFSLPGFNGVMRAFRTYKPEPDTTKPAGWKFVSDGTPLWPDLDGRPYLAGQARVPANADTRNIYTFIPDGNGGGAVVPFTAGNAATLMPHMNVGPATLDLIEFVRAQPLGAIIGSTPALMDPPSLDPPPDDDYGRTDVGDSFAGRYKDRRSIIFFGANDGMIHAVDARTGYEVWAFIPYNLLPKLRTLADGRPVEQFEYFVDSSPKIAEVKINGDWRSLLIIGQGDGGIFYQAFDVTEAGMGVDPTADDLGGVDSLLARFDAPNESIHFKWAFPNYSSFDPTYTGTFTVAEGTQTRTVRLYGDLKSSASFAEKTVGFSWSDPAVGPLDSARTTNAVIVGSGYFPAIEDLLPGRGASAPRAGAAMYLLDIETGRLIGNPSGASCPVIASGSGTGTGCVLIANASNGRKNALQADPTAAGNPNSHVVNKAYIGDLGGRYWRFGLAASGQMTVDLMTDTGQPIYASSALLFIGSKDVYMFFATGSDILPVTAPGGTGTFRLIGLKENAPASGATVRFTRDLAQVSASGGQANGERPSTSPSVAGDIVFYTTTTQSAASPCSDFTARLYALTYLGGAAYDADNNGRIDSNESPVVASVAGRATAPFIVDQHLYFGTAGATGPRLQSFGDPEDFNNGVGQVGVRILSWREIR